MKGLPDYVDGACGRFDLAEHGVIDARADGDTLVLSIGSPLVRVYDVWVEVEGEWCQLNRAEEDVWHSDLGVEGRVRLWLARKEAPATLVMPQERAPAVELAPYVPVVEGAPPLPSERPHHEIASALMRWMRQRQQEMLVAAMLEEWDLACAEATALGWMPNLPTGADLLPSFAKTVPRATADPDTAFVRWLVFETGRATKVGIEDRLALEARRAAVRVVWLAQERLARAVAPHLEIDSAPPPLIGPLDRHRWLVDEGLAVRVDNPAVPDAPHRPVFMLRPLVQRDGEVLVEGEVV